MPETTDVKAIIFDLGGVLLNINYNLTVEAMKNLGFRGSEENYSKQRQDGIFDEFEKGKVGWNDVLISLKMDFGVQGNDESIRKAWNTMLLDFPVSRKRMLESLGERYSLYLLSNNNETHYGACQEIITSSTGVDFNSLFDKAYYSHLMGLRKPDKAIFQQVLDENQLNPGSVVFIDDSIQHIESAATIGLNAFHLKENEKIEDLLSRLNILT